MASNSDSIYYVLTHMNTHPEMVTAEPIKYTNVITLSIPDTVKVADADIYFPDQKLMVNRLSPDFVAKNGDLLDYFYRFTAQEIPNYHDVWVTTSHIVKKNAYMVELSYE
ncbi:hypothetical protein LOOC260_116190 [Paucilactobacillus hokkaidonensis JCM 18461]|uniref:Uncharacterized protein n=2 Tax=Paucilactobacillus hokkaidonensis TaxID=1193095 RepID=A0A0A1GYQ4_9LACO|nr:hypothetical protein [Paucilactobacillus hokkaidonensis]KRO08957.1 hypothetical protein IV59_GL001005 [Paucilactobacillus hokkaidonensis]BAP86128.1 hypothetical protein LOOC260_116190 [Paucilactobacillus hokkaidonensis JCM 18461]